MIGAACISSFALGARQVASSQQTGTCEAGSKVHSHGQTSWTWAGTCRTAQGWNQDSTEALQALDTWNTKHTLFSELEDLVISRSRKLVQYPAMNMQGVQLLYEAL